MIRHMMRLRAIKSGFRNRSWDWVHLNCLGSAIEIVTSHSLTHAGMKPYYPFKVVARAYEFMESGGLLKYETVLYWVRPFTLAPCPTDPAAHTCIVGATGCSQESRSQWRHTPRLPMPQPQSMSPRGRYLPCPWQWKPIPMTGTLLARDWCQNRRQEAKPHTRIQTTYLTISSKDASWSFPVTTYLIILCLKNKARFSLLLNLDSLLFRWDWTPHTYNTIFIGLDAVS